jgi:hypothetical protein
MATDFDNSLADPLELTAGPTVHATTLVIPTDDRVALTWAHANDQRQR